MKNLATTWEKIKNTLGEPLSLPSNLPLWNNPWITLQQTTINWHTWREKGIETIEDLIDGQKILPWSAFSSKFSLPNAEFFKYMQLRDFITHNFNINSLGQKSRVDDIIFNTETDKKMIGKIYNGLLKNQTAEHLLENKIELWNRDLGRTDIGQKWKECWNITNEITANENLRLIQYKIMYRIYHTRDKIHKYYSNTSENCFKCGTKDSLIHAFWECTKVKRSWYEIEQWLSEVLKVKLSFNPSICILHDISFDATVRYPGGWIILLSSIIYKKLILQSWKAIKPPTIHQWKKEMWYYLNMELLIATDKNKKDQFKSIWGEIMKILDKVTDGTGNDADATKSTENLND